jgi:2-polyprenyl-6-methoxyphenol hydroxylase-like FAD-dependent oxidoreductase
VPAAKWRCHYHKIAYHAYEYRFRDFVDRKQQSAQQFATSFTPKTHLGLFVRDFGLRLTAFSTINALLMRRFMTDQFELPDYPD